MNAKIGAADDDTAICSASYLSKRTSYTNVFKRYITVL
jgi:hypothetical protein